MDSLNVFGELEKNTQVTKNEELREKYMRNTEDY